MIIYLWRVEGRGVRWAFSWGGPKPAGARAINLDHWYEYDMDDDEALACLEAVERAEELLND